MVCDWDIVFYFFVYIACDRAGAFVLNNGGWHDGMTNIKAGLA